MIIVGGGYVAAEFAHVFSAFGTRSPWSTAATRCCGTRTARSRRRFTGPSASASTCGSSHDGERRAAHRDRRRRRSTSRVRRTRHGRRGRPPAGRHRPDAQRRPARRRTAPASRWTTTATWWSTRTSGPPAPGSSRSATSARHHQLKHVANHEARVVQHNLLHPDAMIASRSPVRAARGLLRPAGRLRRAHRGARPSSTGIAYVVGQTEYGATAYGWAMGDTGDHFVKLLADPPPGCCSART